MLTACVDHDYDLSKDIDLTVTLGGNELTLPTSSTDVYTMAQILDLDPENSSIKPVETQGQYGLNKGDYVLTQTGDPSESTVSIDAVNLSDITGSTVTIVDMADYEPSKEIREIPVVAEAHQKTIELIAGGTGEDGEGGAALGTTTAKFQPEDEIKGIPEGKLRDTAVMDLINKIQLEASGADVSAAALFKDTSDLPEGDINYGNIFDIYKFDNTLYRVKVTGAELKAYMEWSASHYNTWKPGDINISFDPEVPGYLYDMFEGVDYEIDLSQEAGQRIKNVMFKGEPLKDDQELTLAVNNYRYSSGLKTLKLVAGTKEWESSEPIRDMIVNYFAEHSPVEPTVNNNWKIVGVDLQLDNPERAEIIKKINAGEIETPYAKSYNLNGVEGNMIFDGKGADITTVTGADGETYYTRAGSFVWAVGANGALTLATSDGYPVLGTNGNPITLPANVTPDSVVVGSDGSLGYVTAEGTYTDMNQSFALYQFNNPGGLEKVGDNLLAESAASGVAMNEATTQGLIPSQIRQKYLEGSNVQVADEMVNMIIAQRAYQLNSKAITTSDEMLEQANNLKR